MMMAKHTNNNLMIAKRTRHRTDPPEKVETHTMAKHTNKNFMIAKKTRHRTDPPEKMETHTRKQNNAIDPPAIGCASTKPGSIIDASVTDRRVRFSRKTTIMPHSFEGKEIQRLWYSREDIESFMLQRRTVINHVQNISTSIANMVDASEYMGLEMHLSRRLGE